MTFSIGKTWAVEELRSIEVTKVRYIFIATRLRTELILSPS